MKNEIFELVNKYVEKKDTATSLTNELCSLIGVGNELDLNKYYDKLFKEKWGEERCEGSVYPSVLEPEAFFIGGKWCPVNGC